MKKNVLILAAALALVACGGNALKKKAAAETQTTTAAVPDMHTAETSLDYLGTYEGTLMRCSTRRAFSLLRRTC